MKTNATNFRVTEPCSANWEQMRGDDRRRFCDHCQKHVHNLSAMTEREKVLLMHKNSRSLCIAYKQRSDGSVANFSLLALLRRWFPPLRLASWTALVALLPVGLTGCIMGKRPAMGRIAPARATEGKPSADTGSKPETTFGTLTRPPTNTDPGALLILGKLAQPGEPKK